MTVMINITNIVLYQQITSRYLCLKYLTCPIKFLEKCCFHFIYALVSPLASILSTFIFDDKSILLQLLMKC